MRQQMRFVADENGMLLLALIQAHDGVGDLADQVAAKVRRLQIERRMARVRVKWSNNCSPSPTRIARCNIAGVNYYFGSKHRLYIEVLARRLTG